MSGYEISDGCPNCGGREYSTRRPTQWVAFVEDRVCKKCETRYTPPTPLWTGFLFIAMGFLLVGIGAFSLLYRLVNGNLCAVPGLLFEGFCGFLGILAIGHGMRALVREGR